LIAISIFFIAFSELLFRN